MFAAEGRLRVDRRSADTQHVGLPTAAALVLFGLTGKQVDGTRCAKGKLALDAVAHAMSSTVPIYVTDGHGVRPLDPFDLATGAFDRGALVFRRADGAEITGLSVQRRDMALAIDILKAVKARFEPPA
jgi:hypothetical protein